MGNIFGPGGGGGSSPLTTKGDLYTSTGGADARLPVGTTNGMLLRAASAESTGLIWNYRNSSVITRTTLYNADLSDDIILCSSAAFTVTLPTAVGCTGKVFTIKKTDVTLANIITIATTSSQTIDGATTTTLNTQYETLTLQSDGANWQVLDRRIPQIKTTFTPTGSWTNGGGSVTYTGQWVRDGKWVNIDFYVSTTGSVTGTTLTFNLPSGITLDTADLLTGTSARTVLGSGTFNDNSANAYPLIAFYSSTTAIAVAYHQVSGSDIIRNALSATAPVTIAASDFVELKCRIPVSGWVG
jgi:hypothetical protein